MARLAIAVIHGMGSQDRKYSRPLRDEINDRLGAAGASQVQWGEIYWADVLKKRQKDYIEQAKNSTDLDYISLRRFMVGSFGDASAYRKTKDKKDTTYQKIHQRVSKCISDLDDPATPDTPLIVLAHSLGGHIMSNYIYDMQKKTTSGATGLSSFQRMETLAGFITFGCNIPFFVFAYAKKDIKPIRFPGKALAPALRKKVRWLNFFDPDDVLGYPLRPINQAYNKIVDKDIPINVGGILTSWNPMSHLKYWTDNDFTKPVARFIKTLL
jgi:hypothetical protein